MANTTRQTDGFFGGRALLQQSNTLGGARHVFAKLDDIKNDLVFPTFGGRLTNPALGTASKIYAGDLFEFKTDGDGNGQTVTLLRTFRAAEATTGKHYIPIEKKFGHKPYVGGIIGREPSAINEASSKTWVIARVEDHGDAWYAYPMDSDSATFDVAKGEIFVEVGSDDKMLVKNINAVAAWDYDLMYSDASVLSDEGEESNENAARYFITPTLRGTMIKSKMSPIPACIEAFNISNINGWFRVDALNKPLAAQALGV